MTCPTSKLHLRSLLAPVITAAIISSSGLLPAVAEEPAATNAPAAAAPIAAIVVATVVATTPVALTGEQALQQLLDGNERFVADKCIHPDQSADRRAALTKGQAPFAIVLTCSDSRVSPELFFDQGLGDLFVIRNAGNVLDDHVIGSMEYAVEHLQANLIIVVGHEKCGAVSAAVTGGEIPGHIHSVTDDLAPAVGQTKGMAGDKVDNAVRANALRDAQILTHVEPFLKEAAGSGKLLIVAARYDLTTGKIQILK